jgi:hypothetical protein
MAKLTRLMRDSGTPLVSARHFLFRYSVDTLLRVALGRVAVSTPVSLPLVPRTMQF